MHTLGSLCDDLHRLGLTPDDPRPLIVHSALKAVGPIEGGADTMIHALLHSLGSGGTLLFPNLNIPHAFDAERPPRFDLQRDPIRRQLGILPQRFKEDYATHFSRHTTHAMMGCGPACEALFAGHEKAGLCCGVGTPWWRLGEGGGQILLLGATQQNNTSIHGAEEMLADYQLTANLIEGTVIDRGEEIRVQSRLHRWGNASDFSRINPSLEEVGGLKCGRIGDAASLLVDATHFQAQLCRRLRENPRFLLL